MKTSYFIIFIYISYKINARLLNQIKNANANISEQIGLNEKINERADNARFNFEKTLTELNDKVKVLKLDIYPYKNTGTYVINSVEEIKQLIDDQLNTVKILKASPYIAQDALLQKATNLEHRFELIQSTLDSWMKCQEGWLYLRSIFSSDDVKAKLSMEKAKFDSIDKSFRVNMGIVKKNLRIFDNVEIDLEKLNIEFKRNNEIFDHIQKNLADYSAAKRGVFARFYFLSDNELLEILSQSKNHDKIQASINKCFEAINLVEFNKNLEITSMMSVENERVQFIKFIAMNGGDKKGNIEKCLLEVEQAMQATLKHITKESIKVLNTPRVKWVLSWPGQIVLAASSIKWTQQVESALLRQNGSDLGDYENSLNDQLKEIVHLVRGNLTELERLKLRALIVIDVHARDVVHEMVVRRVEQITDFEWTSQLRYYWEEPLLNIQVRMVNASINYNFEYLGNSTRLVITPLTDKCYRTLLGAFHLFYGGAPAVLIILRLVIECSLIGSCWYRQM